jgi:putative phosphoesterase
MDVAVISDTHLREPDQDFLDRLAELGAGCEVLLHAGDLVSAAVLDALPFPRVEAVAGNMDLPELRGRLPEQKVLDLAEKRIGLIHGWGSPFGLTKKVRNKFSDVDCIVFGHTHHVCNEMLGGVLMFNPGAARGKFFGGGTMGRLTIGQTITGRIIEL